MQRKAAEVDAAIASAEQTELQRVPQLTAKVSYTRLSYIAPVNLSLAGFNFVIPFLQNNTLGEIALNVPLSDYVLRYPKLIEAAHLGEEVGGGQPAIGGDRRGRAGLVAYYERSCAPPGAHRGSVSSRRSRRRSARSTRSPTRSGCRRPICIRVESQEAEAEQTVDQLRNVSDLREEQLRILIGANSDEALALGEDVRTNVTAPPAAKLDELMQHAIARRLDLRTP